MITLCATCGTSYDDRGNTLNHCRICEDERQYVPASGQARIKPDDLIATHMNKWQQHNERLLSFRTVPKFAIDQRAFLLLTPQGNILWDCIANLDAASKADHRAWRDKSDRHFSSSLLHHDAGLGSSL